ncbi:MAG: FG-GAP-like repeat-containing protein [Candidatus Altiarchaeota archaeon]
MRKITIALLTLLLVQTQVCADAPRMNLQAKWSYNTRGQIGGMVLADYDGDGKNEVYIGLRNDTILVLDRYGSKVAEFALGNASQIGGVYSMDVADVNGDGMKELIFGLGGAKEVRTYEAHDFEIGDKTLTPKDKVLYRVVRKHGGVYVTGTDGTMVWRYLTDDSVKSVRHFQRPEGAFIAAGVGDLVIYTYNERSNEEIEGKEVCTEEEVTDEEARWTSETDCKNHTKCCEDLLDCACRWSEKTLEDGQTEDVCYRSYTELVCGKEKYEQGWHLVDYRETNGTLTILDNNGKLKGKYDIRLLDDKGKIVAEADNSLLGIYSAKMGQIYEEILTASSNGQLTVLNVTNLTRIQSSWKTIEEYLTDRKTGDVMWAQAIELRAVSAADINNDKLTEVVTGSGGGLVATYDSRGKLMWKQKVDAAVTDITVDDIESDDSKDIVVSSRDMSIYVYDPEGDLSWSYQADDSIYGVEVTDLDDNSLKDILIFTTQKVERYETTEFYIKRFRADSYYSKAYDKFVAEDYTGASIFLDRAISLYREIDDRDGIPKCNTLRARIDDEFKLRNKQDADRLYNLALSYYASNDLENTMKNADAARIIYEKIGDKEGIGRCDSLEANAKDEARTQKKIMADGYYGKAVTLSSFQNYTGALELIDKAKETYAEADYYNETVKCDMFVLGIADRHYRLAEAAFKSEDYVKAISYAKIARDLYLRAGSVNASETAGELLREATDAMNNPKPNRGADMDYMPYVLGAAAVIILLAAYSRIKRPKTRVMRMPPQAADEELEALEKENL